MQKKNYQKELDKKIEQIVSEKKVPRLFLHSCCAPCSSYVLEYLSEYFEITVFYYNPNIARSGGRGFYLESACGRVLRTVVFGDMSFV